MALVFFKRTLAVIYIILFGLGLLIYSILAIPYAILIDVIFRRKSYLLQRANSISFRILFWGLDVGNFLKVKTVNGNCYEGTCIIIANHPSFFDVLLLIVLIPRMSVLASRRLLTRSPFGIIIKLSGYVFSPGWRKTPYQSIKDCMKMLKKGYRFMLFPEGTRSTHGGLGNFNYGAFKLSEETGFPIQPVLIRMDTPFGAKGKRLYDVTGKTSYVDVEFMDLIEAPEKGKYKEVSKMAENKFRLKLGLETVS